MAGDMVSRLLVRPNLIIRWVTFLLVMYSATTFYLEGAARSALKGKTYRSGYRKFA